MFSIFLICAICLADQRPFTELSEKHYAVDYLRPRVEPRYTNGWTEGLVLHRKQYEKPLPGEYLTREHILDHLKRFNYGASLLIPNAYINLHEQLFGYPKGTYVIPRVEMDYLLAQTNGDLAQIESIIGLPPGKWQFRDIRRVDIPFPFQHGLRMSSGNENFIPINWLPGGVDEHGYSWAVIDPVPKGQYRVADELK